MKILLLGVSAIALGVFVFFLRVEPRRTGGGKPASDAVAERVNSPLSEGVTAEKLPDRLNAFVPDEAESSREMPSPGEWLAQNQDAAHSWVIGKMLLMAEEMKRIPDERREALEHALNLLPDEEYGKLDRILADTNTPASLHEVVLTDLYNRQENTALTTAVKLLEVSDQSIVHEAKLLLAFHLGEDDETTVDQLRQLAQKQLSELSGPSAPKNRNGSP